MPPKKPFPLKPFKPTKPGKPVPIEPLTAMSSEIEGL